MRCQRASVSGHCRPPCLGSNIPKCASSHLVLAWRNASQVSLHADTKKLMTDSLTREVAGGASPLLGTGLLSFAHSVGGLPSPLDAVA